MATKPMDFLIRVHVNAEERTNPKWIKRELVRSLAGERRGDGLAVFSNEGGFDVTHANGSRAWEVANKAISEIEAWVESDYSATDELAPRMAQLELWRKQLGPKPL